MHICVIVHSMNYTITLKDIHTHNRMELFCLCVICTIPCRAEQQRNQALQNAEKLKEAFKDYKATISVKLQKVHLSK